MALCVCLFLSPRPCLFRLEKLGGYRIFRHHATILCSEFIPNDNHDKPVLFSQPVMMGRSTVGNVVTSRINYVVCTYCLPLCSRPRLAPPFQRPDLCYAAAATEALGTEEGERETVRRKREEGQTNQERRKIHIYFLK